MSSVDLERLAAPFEALRHLDPGSRADAMAALSLTEAERVLLGRLLDADGDAHDPLAQTLADAARLATGNSPQRVGPYRLLHELGAGGMGTVFLAERIDGGFRQQVAIKLLRGFPTAEGLRRLRQERQILAGLDHPHIASLLDGGETADGQPWLALDYVDGLPLLEYAARNTLDLRARLALCIAMLDAVGHAHQRLVVHRDLKPANVLVNAAGEVKLLDFGIARLLELDAAAASHTSTRVFSQGYASPEQREGGAITTASDLYSVGVVLQELVTARRAGALASHPALIALPLDAELGGIVAKATAPDPARRYASASEFTDDLQRYLGGRPVRAARMTRWYRLRKFAGRHRAGVSATAAVALALVFFVWRLDVSRQRALTAEAVAQQASTESARDAASARDALGFLVAAFRAAAPENALNNQVSVRELLDAARRTLAAQAGDATISQTMQRQLARLYGSLGEAPIAVELMRAGLVGQTPHDRPGALRLAADHDEFSRLLGANNEGGAAIEAATAGAALRNRFAPDDPIERIRSLHALALAHHRSGDDAAALPLLNDAYARSQRTTPPLDLETDVEQTLAALLATNGDCERAQAIVRRGLARVETERPADAPERVPLLRAQATAFNACGDAAGAEPLLREAIALHERVIGSGGAGMMELTNELALSLNMLGRYREAVDMMSRSDRAMTSSGLGGVDAAVSVENYAGLLESAGDYPAALALYRKATGLYDAAHVDADHQRRRHMQRSEARTLALAGETARARAQLEDLRARAERIDGRDSLEYALVTWQLTLVARRMQRAEDGLVLLREAEQRWSALVPPTHPIFANAHRYRAAFAQMQHDLSGADRELAAALAGFEAAKALPVDVAITRSEIAALRLQQGRRKEAAALLTQALPILRDALLPGEVSRADAERVALQLGMAP